MVKVAFLEHYHVFFFLPTVATVRLSDALWTIQISLTSFTISIEFTKG